jgi:NAD+ diphosphatase
MIDDPSARTGYGENPLDRLGMRRDDADFVTSLFLSPATRHFVFSGDIPCLRQTEQGLSPFFTRAQTQALGQLREPVLLGADEAGAIFAQQLDEPLPEAAQNGAPVQIDLRSLAVQGLLPASQLGALAEAKSLLHWHARHGFCAHCGARTKVASAGWKRSCEACGTHHFPRTDPVVIMLVMDGERCLVGRQARFNPGMYSALAGFIEPGETIEAAVRREVAEEAAIAVGAVAYHASQPWPFPASLMIGCFAQALSSEITVETSELEDARWLTREDVRAIFAGTHPERLVPPNRIAIAWHLLRAFAEGREPRFS